MFSRSFKTRSATATYAKDDADLQAVIVAIKHI